VPVGSLVLCQARVCRQLSVQSVPRGGWYGESDASGASWPGRALGALALGAAVYLPWEGVGAAGLFELVVAIGGVAGIGGWGG